MSTVNLAFHITGPDWAWAVLSLAVAILAILSAVRAVLQLRLHFMRRKAINAAVAAARHHSQSAGVCMGSAGNSNANQTRNYR